jgi:signal transduction histidine kinase
MIWIPGIIPALALSIPGKTSVAGTLLLGIFGPVLLSYNSNNGASVSFAGFTLPWAAAALILFVPVTALSMFVNRICVRIEETEKHYHSLELNNTKLGEINNAISQRIFSLTNDTTQKERNRLSKEIHDTVGYVFINLIMMLQAALAVIFRDTKKSAKLISDARDYAEKGINEIRHLLRDIRDYNPTLLSIQNEIFTILDSFQKATDVKIDINYDSWPKTFSAAIDSFFISFMQESLTNAVKHGHAGIISVQCWQNTECFGMTVSDNGGGARLPVKKGIGITAMEDVAGELGGEVVIKSDKNGFTITVTVPVSILIDLQ